MENKNTKGLSKFSSRKQADETIKLQMWPLLWKKKEKKKERMMEPRAQEENSRARENYSQSLKSNQEIPISSIGFGNHL